MKESLKQLDKRMFILRELYHLLDRSTAGFSSACEDQCPDCCTCNVTMTSLEAAHMFTRLDPDEIQALKHRLHTRFSEKRFQMKMTTNEFAKACMEGRDIPEEENDPSWGACPLLEDKRCSIYRVRPLGCRVMMSGTKCRDQGFAQMPPLALTLSNIFGQYIEQLDIQGFSANLTDVLTLYTRSWETNKKTDTGEGSPPLYLPLDNPENSDKKEVFLRNRSIPALMVPPELREDAAPLLKEIAALGRV